VQQPVLYWNKQWCQNFSARNLLKLNLCNTLLAFKVELQVKSMKVFILTMQAVCVHSLKGSGYMTGIVGKFSAGINFAFSNNSAFRSTPFCFESCGCDCRGGGMPLWPRNAVMRSLRLSSFILIVESLRLLCAATVMLCPITICQSSYLAAVIHWSVEQMS
jgi:hypothetical protein